MPEALIGRQPIFNRQMKVSGYEMLYRGEKEVNAANFPDGNTATSQVILNLFMEIGLDNIVGRVPAYINLTKEFITGEHKIPFGPKQVVLEILEDVEVDDEVESAIKALVKRGYTIALDDFVPGNGWDHLVEFVQMIKIEISQLSPQELAQCVRKYKEYNVKLLAEKVETPEEFELCSSLGFDYFQGYFFCKPQIICSERLPENKMNVLSLVKVMQDPEVSVKEVTDLITQNISFSFKIIRYVNSAAFDIRYRIESIDRVIAYIGLAKIKHWVTIMALAGIDDKPTEIIELTLIRTKMCERLAEKMGRKASGSYAIAGLFSTVDVLTDRPMEDILDELHLAHEINDALLKEEGEVGEVLKAVKLYERAEYSELKEMAMCIDIMTDCFMEAILWSREIREGILE